MCLEPFGKKLRPPWKIKHFEFIPLCVTSRAMIFLEGNALRPVKNPSRKCNGEDRQDLMPEAAFMGKNILHEDRRSHDINSDAKFFTELPYERCFSGFAKLD